MSLWLALALVASAWTTEGFAWSLDRAPVEVHWTGEVTGFTHEELAQAVRGAAAAWTSIHPCAFGFDVVEDPDAAAWFSAGGDVEILFTATDGVTRTPNASGHAFDAFADAPATLIAITDDGSWATDAAIDADSICDVLRYSLQGALTHELGHALGLGHSCAETDPCDDPTLVQATMYWFEPVCSTNWSTPSPDDIAGFESMYGGIPLDWSCGPARHDDRALSCSLDVDDPDPFAPTWTFDDGVALGGANVTHEVEGGGAHDVKLCVDSPACDGTLCDTASAAANSEFAPPQTVGPAPAPTGCATVGGSGFAAAWLVGLALAAARGVAGTVKVRTLPPRY